MKGLRHTLSYAYPHLLSLFDELVEKHRPKSVFQLMRAINKEVDELEPRLRLGRFTTPSAQPESGKRREGLAQLDNVKSFDPEGIRVYGEIQKKAEAAMQARNAEVDKNAIRKARQLIELAERARDYEKGKYL